MEVDRLPFLVASHCCVKPGLESVVRELFLCTRLLPRFSFLCSPYSALNAVKAWAALWCDCVWVLLTVLREEVGDLCFLISPLMGFP